MLPPSGGGPCTGIPVPERGRIAGLGERGHDAVSLLPRRGGGEGKVLLVDGKARERGDFIWSAVASEARHRFSSRGQAERGPV